MIKPAVLKVLKESWLLCTLLLFTIVAGMALQLVPALLIRQIVDEHFSKGLFEGVWRLAGFYLAATAGISIVEFVKVIVTTWLGQQVLLGVRSRMSERLSRLPMGYFAVTPVGEVMSRLTTDVDAVNTLFSSGLVGVITDLLKVFGLAISLYILSPQLLWVVLVSLPVVYLLSDYFRKRIYAMEKKVRICVSEIYTFIQEWLDGIQTVKAYGMETEGEAKFQKPLGAHLAAINGISKYDSWFPCVMQTLRAVVIALAIFLGAKNGTPFSLGLTVGTLAAVADLVGRLFAPMEALAAEFQTIQQAMAGIGRIREFAAQPVEERRETAQTPDESRGIDIIDAQFAYGNHTVLNELNLSLAAGEKAVLVGRSGAGKTTLMNIVAGLYAPTQGSVRICGIDPYTLPARERRKLLGVVPQMPQVFNGSVRDNITLRDDTIPMENVKQAVHTVGLDEAIEALPQGYDTLLGEGEAGLSSGEVQLLSLARAIVMNPKVLLLDEPTSGIDARTEAAIFAAIRQAGRGRTILSISHRLSGVIDANRVHILARGNIVESGTAEELAGRDGWYAVYKRMEDAGWQFSKETAQR
ncbi:MAG TPA: ABC transporter ATP-binding protein [Ruminiclostridium sp.]|nr:ABC transporter ATP-binding protein [Ruminiclostridium sp.]